MTTFNKIILQIFKSLFADKNFRFKNKELPLRKINGLRAFKIGNLLFIEQNPKSGSKYARLAKKGKKIMWVIDQQDNKYLARVINGRIERLT